MVREKFGVRRQSEATTAPWVDLSDPQSVNPKRRRRFALPAHSREEVRTPSPSRCPHVPQTTSGHSSRFQSEAIAPPERLHKTAPASESSQPRDTPDKDESRMIRRS